MNARRAGSEAGVRTRAASEARARARAGWTLRKRTHWNHIWNSLYACQRSESVKAMKDQMIAIE